MIVTDCNMILIMYIIMNLLKGMILIVMIVVVNMPSLWLFCFFFSSRRRHTRCSRDWSSDVCSSDLEASRSRAVGYVETSLRDGLTLRGLLKRLAGARGRLAVAGTPEQVADIIEDWFRQIGRASCRERV